MQQALRLSDALGNAGRCGGALVDAGIENRNAVHHDLIPLRCTAVRQVFKCGCSFDNREVMLSNKNVSSYKLSSKKISLESPNGNFREKICKKLTPSLQGQKRG